MNRRNEIQDLLLILHGPAVSLFEPEIDLNSEVTWISRCQKVRASGGLAVVTRLAQPKLSAKIARTRTTFLGEEFIVQALNTRKAE